MLDEAQREIIVHSPLYALVAAAAWTFARGASPHRTIAALFAWELVADLGRIALSPVLDAAPVPYTGGMLALYYIDHGLHLGARFSSWSTTMSGSCSCSLGSWSPRGSR